MVPEGFHEWVIAGFSFVVVLVFGLVFAVGLGLLYLLPYLLARWSGHPDARGLLWVNLLAGWTVVAWLVCLLWVFFGAVRKDAGRGDG